MKLVGEIIVAIAVALETARRLRARFARKPSRDQIARNFRKLAMRADPAAFADFRHARHQLTKESKD